jgi:hypothetical protein
MSQETMEHRGLPGLPRAAYSQHIDGQGWSVWLYGFLPHLNLAVGCDSEEAAIKAAREKWSKLVETSPVFGEFPTNEAGMGDG